MNKVPDISIVVPAYNASSGVERSLRSLMNQTYVNIEIIVINDASTDNTKEIISKLMREDERIVFVDLKNNLGVHHARLEGLKVAVAAWIGFLDADDIAKPQMFEFMLSKAIDNQADIVICGSERVTSSRKHIKKSVRFNRDTIVTEDVFKRFSCFEFGAGALWNKLYKRSIIVPFSNMIFPWRQSINEDLLLNIGCFIGAKKVYLMKESLHEYVYNEESVTVNINKVKAYVENFSAYAIALSYFNNSGHNVINNIVDMYRKQLSWDCCHVNNLNELRQYEDKLSNAVSLINKSFPSGLAMIVARNCECNGINKSTLIKIFVAAVNKYLYRK